jgi:hypothetical protein
VFALMMMMMMMEVAFDDRLNFRACALCCGALMKKSYLQRQGFAPCSGSM